MFKNSSILQNIVTPPHLKEKIRFSSKNQISETQAEELQRKFISLFLTGNFMESIISRSITKDLKKSYLAEFVSTLLDLEMELSCFIVALMYFKNLCKKKKITMENYEENYYVCLMIASKMYNECFWTSLEYFEEFDMEYVEFEEFLELESEIVKKLNYSFFVNSDKFKEFIVNNSKTVSYVNLLNK
eukprot:NODE_3723_length_739_cov_30.653623_g3130_i0.p1 GENE.NODE_3723_length_739_cov_30.653623_g3130_i0~~NODE_3723_length_739_cov_30.653623_g3130_i0.p1  ORF type:complete len:187 (-),score=2.07 NODE_3723_length_739_cov_30.653623_g3130_i0:27-587(-)